MEPVTLAAPTATPARLSGRARPGTPSRECWSTPGVASPAAIDGERQRRPDDKREDVGLPRLVLGTARLPRLALLAASLVTIWASLAKSVPTKSAGLWTDLIRRYGLIQLWRGSRRSSLAGQRLIHLIECGRDGLGLGS